MKARIFDEFDESTYYIEITEDMNRFFNWLREKHLISDVVSLEILVAPEYEVI